MIKRALLSATAFLAATSANAQVADTWTISGAVTVSAINSGDVSNDPVATGGTTGVEAASIVEGFKNSISSAAVGASASSSFTTVNNSELGAETAINFESALSVVAGNEGAVLNANDLAGAVIGGGNANSVSIAAVGSSASVSGSTTLAGGALGADESFLYGAAEQLVVSSGADGAADPADNTIGGNTGTVTVSLGTGFVGAVIDGGNGNSISVAGVGSSSSASFSAAVDAEGTILDVVDLQIGGGAAVNSVNGADGLVLVGLGEGMTEPQINAGNANSISAAAVGSSASFAVSQGVSGGGQITEFGGAIGELQVASVNQATVTLGGGDGADQGVIGTAIIGGGASNSLSAAAVGASGSVSYASTVFDTGNGEGFTGELSFEGITVESTNDADILNNISLAGGEISGGQKNSISIAGVGASASQSISITDNSGLGISTNNTILGEDVILAALNSGAVTVAGGGLATPVIGGGFSNSISAAAVGASASQSVARTVLTGL